MPSKKAKKRWYQKAEVQAALVMVSFPLLIAGLARFVGAYGGSANGASELPPSATQADGQTRKQSGALDPSAEPEAAPPPRRREKTISDKPPDRDSRLAPPDISATFDLGDGRQARIPAINGTLRVHFRTELGVEFVEVVVVPGGASPVVFPAMGVGLVGTFNSGVRHFEIHLLDIDWQRTRCELVVREVN